MAGVVPVPPRFQFSSTTGVALSGGSVDVYLAGTTTRSNTWSDKAQTTLNTNPIVLDASGSCAIFGADNKSYKLVVKNSAGVVQSHLGGDNISCAGNTTDLAAAAAAAAAIAAQPYVDAAEAAQLAAEAAETNAETAETNAETAQAAAETARDAALAATSIYADTTAGLAAVASGEYFYVPSSDTDESLILYKDNAGVAVETKRYSSALADIKRRNESDLASLPGAPRGLWIMDRYRTTGRAHVPNSVADAAYAQYNLFSAPRRRFANSTFWSTTGATVTEDNVVGPTGATDAARVQITAGNDHFNNHIIANLPAGTYTFVVAVRSNSGADHSFRMGAVGGVAPGLAAKTALAASETRFTQTFTLLVTTTVTFYTVRAPAGLTAVDVRLSEASLFSGSTDLGRSSLVGHLVFGPDAWNRHPTYATGAITLGSGASSGFGLAQFESANTVYEWTVMAVARRKGNPTGIGSVQSALGSLDGFQYLTAALSDGVGEGPYMAFAATEVIGSTKAGLWNYTNNDTVCIGSRYDGTEGSLWRGDVRAVEGGTAGLTASIKDLVLGAILGGDTANYDILAVGYWERALTDSEMREAYFALKSRVARGASSTVLEPRFLCAEGDSITWGTGTGVTASYAHTFGANSSPQVDGVVPAVASATLLTAYEIIAGNSLQTRASYIDAMIPASKRGRKFVLSLLVGNDFANGYTDATAYAAAVSAYCALRKAAGWDKIVLITILPRTTANFNTRRNSFNTIVRAGPWAAANSVDAICDFGADATYGVDAAASDVVKYPDGVHPSQTAQTALEVLYRATVNAL